MDFGKNVPWVDYMFLVALVGWLEAEWCVDQGILGYFVQDMFWQVGMWLGGHKWRSPCVPGQGHPGWGPGSEWTGTRGIPLYAMPHVSGHYYFLKY